VTQARRHWYADFVDTSDKRRDLDRRHAVSEHLRRPLPYLLSSRPFCLVNPTAIAISHVISRADTRQPRRSPASGTVDSSQTAIGVDDDLAAIER
jgi:hypothetical protein